MKVEDLKPGIQFRLSDEMIFKTVVEVFESPTEDNIDPVGRKISVLSFGTDYYSILKGQEVEVKCTHTHLDGTDAFKTIGTTHKEIFKCQICGETTSA